MRRFSTLLLAAAAAALAVAPAANAYIPKDASFTNAYFPSADGTQLHADVLRPKGIAATAKTPVILSIGPYFNHTGQTGASDGAYDPSATEPNERFKDMMEEGHVFQKGYSVVNVDLRGFGGSAGCNDFGGVGEQADVKAAVEWASSQAWSTGKVGMWGKSYDGWTEVMGLATKPKGLAAAVIMSPIIDGYRTLYMNGVHYATGWYATPAVYQADDATPGSPSDDPAYTQGWVMGTNPVCYGQNILEQNLEIDKDTTGFWRSRDLVPRASSSSVPVLWSHGFDDANTKPNNFLDVYSRLSGPKRAWFGQYTHQRPQDKYGKGLSVTGREGFIDEAMRWFDRYLKGDQSAPVEKDPPVEVEDGGLQKYRAEAAWPPADGVTARMPLKDGTITDQQGNDGETGPGDGLWSISQTLTRDVHLAGVPKIRFTAVTSSPRMNTFAILYDVNEKNQARLVTRGAYAVKAPQDSPWYELYPQDWTFKPGHRIALLMANSDDGWFTPPPTQQTATVSQAELTFPVLTKVHDKFLPSLPSQFERSRGAPFAVPADALKNGTVTADLPPRATAAKRRGR
jgi:predicted acyl esterase